MRATIRPAEARDIPAMAALAARLVHEHHAADPLRFMLPEDVERGYMRWFGHEHGKSEVVMRVADDGGAVAGYTYARLEARDWNALLDAFGALHDIYVAEAARKNGIGEALLRATLDGLRALGAPRCVLHTMWGNAAAQRLFERAGFRRTMIEMTCELDLGAPEE
jgi:ribosomal protein S18 acetylase RimI-like enzyme